MSGIYSTNKIKNLNQLNDVNITDVSNNDIIQYNASSGLWENKTELVTGDITCDNLQVLGTCNVDGEFSTDAVTKLYNNRYIFGADAEFEGNFIVDTAQNTLYVDTINHRVGINKIPEEDLDVDGNIQINTNGTEKITFYDNGHDHEHGKLLFTTDGTDGAEFEVHTLTDGGSVTQKLTINNVGAIGLGATPDYGTTGSVLTSNGSGSAPTWNEPYYFKAEMSANQSTTSQNTTIDLDRWTASLSSPYDGNNGDLTSTTEWTAPTDGLYVVYCKLNMYNGNDFLRRATVTLNKDSGSGYSVVSSGTIIVSSADTTDIVTFQPHFYDLIPMNSGDKFKITFLYTSNGGALTIFAGASSLWTITKVV